MVNRAIFVGVGGSGCKCLESLVHVAAAGLLPIDGDLVFVDQDKSNFCTTRALRVAENYQELGRWLGRSDTSGTGALHARLRVEPDVLPPLPEVWETLQAAFSVAGDPRADAHDFDDAWLMRALFTRAERTDSMNNGFRARPAVGSAAYSLSVARPYEMWRRLAELLDEERHSSPRQVEVVLFGSIFGGTGAAGLPSLGRMLRNHAKSTPGLQLRVSAILLLPYYYVTPPEGERRPYGPVPSGQVRLALDHYVSLLADPTTRPFDTVYLAGLDRRIELPYDPKGGGAGQDNPPLAPELVAALGAAHLCANSQVERAAFYCVREKATVMTLRDLPAVGGNLPEPGEAFANLVRCGIAYLSAYYPILWHAARGKASVSDYSFLRSLITRRTLLSDVKAFDLARIYFQNFLTWAAALEMHDPGLEIGGAPSREERVSVDFFDADNFADFQGAPKPKVSLKFGMNGAEADPPAALNSREIRLVKNAFGALSADSRALLMHEVLERLSRQRLRGRSKPGARRFLEALYDASTVARH